MLCAMRRSLFGAWLLISGICLPILCRAESTVLKPLFVTGSDRTVQNDLLGVWQKYGYGRLIVIHNKGYDLYHTTDLLCYRDPTGADLSLENRYSLYQGSGSGKDLRLYFHVLGENTTRYQNFEQFTKLSQLPASCVNSIEAPEYRDPQFVFDLFWQTFREQYAFFEQRGMDWQGIRAMYRPRVNPKMSPDELFNIFKEILQPLNDGHVHLYLGAGRHFHAGDNIVLKRLREAFESQKRVTEFGNFVGIWASGLKQTVSENLLTGPVRRVANDQIWWGSINDQIGYINIFLLTNFIKGGGWKSRAEQLKLLDEVFDEIFQAFDSKSAILLDLTHNQGGFDEASDLIASRFADRRRHVLTIQPAGVPLNYSQQIFVTPSSRTRFTKPVYVLTSPITVSAGEGLVAMLKAFPHVRQVGEATRGYFSGILNKPLPSGLAISVTNQRVMSPEGHPYEVEGNSPDISLDVFAAGDLHSGYRRALDSTIAIMMKDFAVHQAAVSLP